MMIFYAYTYKRLARTKQIKYCLFWIPISGTIEEKYKNLDTSCLKLYNSYHFIRTYIPVLCVCFLRKCTCVLYERYRSPNDEPMCSSFTIATHLYRGGHLWTIFQENCSSTVTLAKLMGTRIKLLRDNFDVTGSFQGITSFEPQYHH